MTVLHTAKQDLDALDNSKWSKKGQEGKLDRRSYPHCSSMTRKLAGARDLKEFCCSSFTNCALNYRLCVILSGLK